MRTAREKLFIFIATILFFPINAMEREKAFDYIQPDGYYFVKTRDKNSMLLGNELRMLMDDSPVINKHITDFFNTQTQDFSTNPPGSYKNPFILQQTSSNLEFYLKILKNPALINLFFIDELNTTIAIATATQSNTLFPHLAQALIHFFTMYPKMFPSWLAAGKNRYLKENELLERALRELVQERPFIEIKTYFNVNDTQNTKSRSILAISDYTGYTLGNRRYLTVFLAEDNVEKNSSALCTGETVKIYDFGKILQGISAQNSVIQEMRHIIPMEHSPACRSIAQKSSIEFRLNCPSPKNILEDLEACQECAKVTVTEDPAGCLENPHQKCDFYSVSFDVDTGNKVNFPKLATNDFNQRYSELIHGLAYQGNTSLSATYNVSEETFYLSTEKGLQALYDKTLPPLSVAFSTLKGSSRYFASLTKKNLFLWDLESSVLLEKIPLPAEIKTVVANLDSSHYMTDTAEPRRCCPPFFEIYFTQQEGSLIGIIKNYVIIWEIHDSFLENYIRESLYNNN
jgi:hypothetical protein